MYSKDGGDIPVPTITPFGAYEGDKINRKQRTQVIAAAGASAALLVAMALTIVYFCLMHAKRSARRTSAAATASPSSQQHSSMRKQRSFTFKELEQATSSFNQKNIVGQGGFGTVYKGLLNNGSLVAIKRRFCQPSQYFVQQAMNIGSIQQHKHIVILRGYCQEAHQQFLVYDYLPNSNVGFHLC